MMRRAFTLILALAGLALTTLAQPSGGSGRRPGPIGGGEIWVPEEITTAREIQTRTDDQAIWTNPPAFKKDVFTFARVRYDKDPWRPGRRGGGGWTTDLPDADLNLSFRVQQMTSIRVDADGRLIRLTDPELVRYPFLFVSAPGALYLTDEEAEALGKHLMNGAFILMDDFWGEEEWENCEAVFKKVFPGRKFFELPLSHPLYQAVFPIDQKYQNANVGMGIASQRTGVTWERSDGREVHHRAITDDKGRLMVLALHNTDTADGWEREGESDYYFHNFSEKIAFPLGVNIIHYIMSH